MGDKTQLLTLLLVAHYRKPWSIVAGIFAATLLNHTVAGLVGAELARVIGADAMRVNGNPVFPSVVIQISPPG